MTAVCRVRGCSNATAGERWTLCAPCAMGHKPAVRRKELAALAVEAMPPMAVPGAPGAAFGFRVPGSPLGVNRAFMPAMRGARSIRHTPEAREWRTVLRAYAVKSRPQGWRLDATYTVEVHSVFASPLADTDGPVKLVLDALQGLAFGNDRQVTKVSASKGPADPGHARLEVIVRYAPAPPEGQPCR